MPETDDLRSLTFRDYVSRVWVKLWLAVAVTVVCTGAAFLVANHQARKYQAEALLMYQPAPNISNLSTSSVDSNTLNIQLQNVINAIGDPVLVARARNLLSSQDAGLDAKVTATLYTSPTAGANVFPNQVQVAAETASAGASARIANAYAKAVIAQRRETQVAGYRAAQAVLQNQKKLFTQAQQSSAEYNNLVTLLNNLEIAAATATGDFAVSRPATVPLSPASPRPLRSAAIGFGVGLVAGIGLAFAVGKFDTRVRTQRDAAEVLGLPSMARLPRISRQALRQDGLVTMSEPDGTFSEALRMLRSNLEWSNIDDNLRTVLVTSSIKGEGKTLTTCNLAVTLARAGKNVVVVDADLRDPRVHKVFNLPNSAGLTSVVRGTVPLDRAFQVFEFSPATHVHLAKPALSLKAASDGDGGLSTDASEGEIFVLTSGPIPPDPGEVVASRKLAAALLEIGQSNADYVLIDAPPLLSVGDAASLSSSCDGLLMVANLGMLRAPTLRRVRELLDTLPCRKLGVVFVGEKVEHPEYYHYKTRSRSA